VGASPKLLAEFVAEFRCLQRDGYIPLKSLGKMVSRDTASSYEWSQIRKLYFETWSIGEYKKGPKALSTQTAWFARCANYFTKKGRIAINQVTEKDLKEFDSDALEFRNLFNGRPLAKSSIFAIKNLFQCVLRAAQRHRIPLLCDFREIDLSFYTKGGEKDGRFDVREVIPSSEILDAIKNSSYVSPNSVPNIKDVIEFLRYTGLRPGELRTLSEENLFPSVKKFDQIKILEKLDCPTKEGIGFSPKCKNSYREITLRKEQIQFIKRQLMKHQGDKIYARVRGADGQCEFVEYRYLFPVWSDRQKKWVRPEMEFVKEFNNILRHVQQEIGKEFEEKYKLYDFRRVYNLYLQLDLDLPSEDAAIFLGHSRKTNEHSYISPSNLQKVKQSRAHAHFLGRVSSNSKMQQEYPIGDLSGRGDLSNDEETAA